VLFNSYFFLFAFLPTALAAFHLLRRESWTRALAAVSVLSLIFYASWDPRYLALLVPSLLINYWLGEQIARTRNTHPGRVWLVAGIAANLAVIGWFKYSLFFYVNLTGGAAAPDFLRDIALPLGISFITFQKIAYLVDIWRGHPKASSFSRFAFFVLFFPQLIAGPIVLFRNLDRQVGRGPRTASRYRSMAYFGLILFAIGLFKKAIMADGIAYFADTIFAFAAEQPTLRPSDAWLGALTYSLQLYFDFSAYSDMAIGIGFMFGFRLPTNFNSPYQAATIIDFWRRWHMTLSAFFREYVYIPLGGNRRGAAWQAVFVIIVFLLTGLWHGAGWTFVAWGGIHGLLVLTNHLWARFTPGWSPIRLPYLVTWPATVLAAVCLWVIFRSPNWAVAARVLTAMTFSVPDTATRAFNDGLVYGPAWAMTIAIGAIALFMPNSRRLARHLRQGRWPGRRTRTASAQPAFVLQALIAGAILYFAIASIGTMQSKFIYFNF
jgi:D-alanyl-lipoteichoic acid acyltransferase DltB (MBOAT superfamily)